MNRSRRTGEREERSLCEVLPGDRSGGELSVSGQLPFVERETKWQAKGDNNVGSLRQRMINKSGTPLREQFNLRPRRDASRSFSFFPVPVYSHRGAARRGSHARESSPRDGQKRTPLRAGRTALRLRRAVSHDDTDKYG